MLYAKEDISFYTDEQKSRGLSAIWMNRQTSSQAARQMSRQTGRQTGRHTDGQTSRQTSGKTEYCLIDPCLRILYIVGYCGV